jgi:hypothetical protein
VIEPSSQRLVVEVAAVLRDRIAPLVQDDPWAASELRSIDAVLALVAARLEHEAEVVAADNEALDALLAELRSAGVPVPDVAAAPDATPAARNLESRRALEASLHLVHDGEHPTQVASVRRYLVAATAREERIFGALAGRRLF